MSLEKQRDSLYKEVKNLVQKVQIFKEELDRKGIDSFQAEEAMESLDSAMNCLSCQELSAEYVGWEFLPEDLEGEFPI
jgi:vacuolar-type H+-ATPase subunit D/Vma8